MPKVDIKRGEAKALTLTVTDELGPVDLSAATLLLGVKKYKTDAEYAIAKLDADFDKTQADQGIVSVLLTAEDTDQAEATYTGELKCSWTGPPALIDKSADFYIQIKGAVN